MTNTSGKSPAGSDVAGDGAGANAAPSPVAGTVADIADEELLRRAVKFARRRRSEPKWAAVSYIFGLGSTYSVQLCRRFGIDPDQNVRRK